MENLHQLKVEIVKQVLSLDNSPGTLSNWEQKDLLRLLKRCGIELKPRFYITVKYHFMDKPFVSEYFARRAYLKYLRLYADNIINHGKKTD